jgi:hypothetical protein
VFRIKKLLILLIALIQTIHLNAQEFNKVIIWGHKLHSSTHSYIHEGFYKGFRALGYDTYWFDDSDDVSSFDFSHALFITEGQVEKKIPLIQDGIYFLHNTDGAKYREASIQPLVFQVYTDDVLSRNCLKVDTCIYYDVPGKCLYMPWATDLLPDEIESIQKEIPYRQKNPCIFWVGTIGRGVFGNEPQINPFIKACEENNVPFIKRNPSATGVSAQEHRDLIGSAYMAPAIVGEWQQTKGYIPCRIFKNISYGQMGITNSERVYEILDKKIVYHPDSYELFYEAKKRIEHVTPEELIELMDIVNKKHTYINRIETMLNFLKLVQQEEVTHVE